VNSGVFAVLSFGVGTEGQGPWVADPSGERERLDFLATLLATSAAVGYRLRWSACCSATDGSAPCRAERVRSAGGRCR
jgi:hypothetical protein